ncbi:MAG TPA: hypothetical protein VGO96_04515, partial [Pyrinomonadaceae bacterium]|nr:hypothetical protein [Pyrinomonadaceae bacterium]
MSSTAQKSSPVEGALRRVLEGEELARLLAEVRGGARVVSVSGLTSGAARALVLAALQRETGKRLAVVVAASRDLEQWDRDLCFWSEALRRQGGDGAENGGASAARRASVLTLPASESDPYAGASPHPETLERRALTLWRLARGAGDFVLLTARALARRTIAPQQLLATGATLRRDEDYAPEELIELLLASGYVREDPLGAVGEFSLRGGILDVWSPGEDAPVRVEFFGDTVDSIREFDPETQLSIAQRQEIEIVPMREYAVGADDFRLWAELARERWTDERYARALRDRTVYADEGETFAGWEWLVSLVHSTPASAFDYLQRETLLVADEPAALETFLGNTYETLSARYAETEGADEVALRPEELYLTAEELRAGVAGVPRVELRTLGRAAAATDERFTGEAEAAAVTIGRTRATPAPLFLFPAVERATEIEWNARAARRYHGRIADLAADVRRAQATNGARVLFAMPSAGVAERVGEMLAEYNVAARVVFAGESGAVEDGQALVTVGRLSGGFELPAAGLVVHVEND